MTLETPQERFAPGFVFEGRYRIIRELGKGGMGRVFLARDLKLERDVALKFIGEAIQRDDRIRERFLREARAAAALDHPFICKIYDTGEIEGNVYIAMEFIEGKNLREITQGKPFPLKDALQVISEISEALEKAHDKGVVHRDLKPENIMRTPQGHAKVMDFGIAKITLPEEAPQTLTLTKESITRDGSIVGTLAYMSPEQACGAVVDRRSDIYSLGVVFYELLSGKQPFSRSTTAETLAAILKDPPPPLGRIQKKHQSAVHHILQRSLAKDPDARFQDISELILEVKRLQKELVAISLPLFRRLSIIIPLFALLTIILLSIFWFAGLKDKLLIKKLPEPVSVLVADFQNNTGDPIFGGTLEEALCIGLEGAPFINIYKRGTAKKLAVAIDEGGSGRLDTDVAQLIARRELIKIVVGGTIDKRGQDYSIRVLAADPINSKTVSEYSVNFKNKVDLLSTIDNIAYHLRKSFGDIAKDPSQRHLIEAFTTKSVEAMEAYARAQTLQVQGNYDEAVEAYQLAVDKDPDFGRAYSGLATTYYNDGQPQKGQEYMQKALARIDRMTDREKYRTRGASFLMNGNYKKASEEYRMLTQQFPADRAGHTNLSMACWGIRDYKQAIKNIQVALAIGPKDALCYRNLAQYALGDGDIRLAEESAKKAIEINAKYSTAYPFLVGALVIAGRFEEAETILNGFAALGSQYEKAAAEPLLLLALYESRLGYARIMLEKETSGSLDSEDHEISSAKAKNIVMLADVLMRQGQRPRALRELGRVLTRRDQITAPDTLFSAALVFIKTHHDNEAHTLAQELLKSSDPFPKGLAKVIEAEIKISGGNKKGAGFDIDESVKFLDASKELEDKWIYRFYLGYAYLMKEAFAEAHSEFEICLKRRGEGLERNDEYEKVALVYYYLGHVQEGLRSPAAAESYKLFLDIKRRSDGDIIVEEAKSRLALLTSKNH